MNQGEQLQLALMLNGLGLYQIRILLKYIFEEMIKLKDDHSNPRFISLNDQFNRVSFVGSKMWEL